MIDLTNDEVRDTISRLEADWNIGFVSTLDAESALDSMLV